MVFTVSKTVSTDNRVGVSDISGAGDGSLWEISYDMRNVQATFIELDFIYTKDASTSFTIQNAHSVYATRLADKYGELIVDSAGEALPITYTISEEGSFFIFLPVGFTAGVCFLTITPDIATGADTLAVSIQEQNEQDRR